MSATLSVNAYSSTESAEFQKHFKAVQFCLENKLSFPKETSEFFKGKLGGDDLEDINPKYIMNYITNGIEVKLPKKKEDYNEIHIRVADIPKEADLIIIKIS